MKSQSATLAMDGHGHLGVASTTTGGTSQSNLAATVAPPVVATAEHLGCMSLVVILFFMAGIGLINESGGAAVLMFIIAAAFTGLAISLDQKAKKANADYPHRLAKWKRQFMCLACGQVREQPM